MGTETITIDQEAIQKFTEESSPVVRIAEAYAIEAAEDYDNSLGLLEEIAQRSAKIIAFFTPTKQKAFELHRAICDQEKKMCEPYLKAEGILKVKREAWRQLCAQQDAVKRREEEERQRKIQEEELLAQAAHLENQGEKEAAQVLLDTAATAPPPIVHIESSVPKQGAGLRKRWIVVSIDRDKLPANYLIPDVASIEAVVAKMGDRHNIAGVVARQIETEAVRRKA